MDARVGLNFMYSEIIRLFGPQVRELLDTLMSTTDGFTPFVEEEAKVPDDEMAERNRELLKRGVKPPEGWKDTMDLEGLFG